MATNNASAGTVPGSASPVTDANRTCKVLVRPSAETTRLGQRHVAALQKMGMAIPAAPAPRQPLSKIPLCQPPGQDHELLVKFGDALMARADAKGNVVISADSPDEALQRVIDEHGLTFATSQTATEEDITNLESRGLANTGTMPADLAGTLLVRSAKSDPAGVMAAARALQSLPSVEFVSVTSRDEPPPPPFAYDIAPPTPLFDLHQKYRGSLGININWAWGRHGAKGRGVRVTDCEYCFNWQHEDLRGLVAPQPGVSNFYYFKDSRGVPSDDHGTATLGVLKAGENNYGVTGTVPLADAHFYGDKAQISAGGEQSRHATITAAAAASAAGDVVVLEMQTWGLQGDYIDENGVNQKNYGPAELDQAVWLAVDAATKANVIVVAAGGNGAQNLDGDEYADYRARGDSGAIIVGAGRSSEKPQLARSKIGFSTYGERVNVQGWGENVTSLGYGRLGNYDTGSRNQRYTATYSGTSSASPVVASAVVAIQSAAREILGRPLTPAEMRGLLIRTGKAQTGDVSLKIGPLPDVSVALANLQTATNDPLRPGVVDLAAWKLHTLAGSEDIVAGQTATNGVTPLDVKRATGMGSGGAPGGYATSGWAGGSTNAGRYVSFGFRVADDKTVFPADLLFTGMVSAANGPADFALRCSGDGYTKNLATWRYTAAAPQASHSIDLSSLGALRGDVEFRIFVTSETDISGAPLTDAGEFMLLNYYCSGDPAPDDSVRFTGSVESGNTPVISALDPATGVPGAWITVRGHKLDSATKVLFGGVEAVFELDGGGTFLHAVVPATARTGPVTVITPHGRARSARDFSIVAGPSDPALAPGAGSPTGFASKRGTASAAQSFLLEGNNLNGKVFVHAPDGFEISADGTNYVRDLELAASPPRDAATNYTAATWTNGSTAGLGFGAWLIEKATPAAGSSAGNTVTDPDISGIGGLGSKAFGLFAGPAFSGAKVRAKRALAAPVKVGDTFRFQWAVNLDAGGGITNAGGGRKGFTLYTGGAGMTPLLTVNQSSDPGAIVIGTPSGATDTGLDTEGTNPMTWSFTRTGAQQLQVTATGRDGSTNVVFTTNVAIVGAPDAFEWFASELDRKNANDELKRHPFYDNLAVDPAAAGGGCVAPRRIFVRLASTAPVGTLSGLVTMTSDQAAGQTVSVKGLVSASGYGAYDVWAQQRELPPDVIEPSADADGDGVENSIEFAMGLDPKSGSGNPMSLARSQGKILCKFLVFDDGLADELGYVVQASDTLQPGSWVDADIQPTWVDPQPLDVPDAYQQVQFEITPQTARKFYRVKVIMP